MPEFEARRGRNMGRNLSKTRAGKRLIRLLSRREPVRAPMPNREPGRNTVQYWDLHLGHAARIAAVPDPGSIPGFRVVQTSDRFGDHDQVGP